MTYRRDIPVAHGVVQTRADFGQPVIDLAPLGSDFATARVEGAQVHPCPPMIDTVTGRACAAFRRDVLDCSHHDSVKCNCDRLMHGAGRQ